MGKKLDHLDEAGIVIKENYSDWAAPIVPVLKQDGSIEFVEISWLLRINPFLNVDQYPLPKPSDFMTCLTGGKCLQTVPYSSIPADVARRGQTHVGFTDIHGCRLGLLWHQRYSKGPWTQSHRECPM